MGVGSNGGLGVGRSGGGFDGFIGNDGVKLFGRAVGGFLYGTNGRLV